MLNMPMCHFIKQPEARYQSDKGEEPPFDIAIK